MKKTFLIFGLLLMTGLSRAASPDRCQYQAFYNSVDGKVSIYSRTFEVLKEAYQGHGLCVNYPCDKLSTTQICAAYAKGAVSGICSAFHKHPKSSGNAKINLIHENGMVEVIYENYSVDDRCKALKV